MSKVLPICRWSELEGKVLVGVVVVLVGPVRIDPEVPSSERGAGRCGWISFSEILLALMEQK